MKIEEAIQTNKFESPLSKALVNIIYTGSYLLAKHAEILKPYGISPQQYNVLRILRGSYPDKLTVQAIKNRMLDKTPNTTRLVDKLLTAGLVLRERCTEDRRVVYVSISDSGMHLMKELDQNESQLNNYLGNLNNAELLQLSDWLDALRNK